MKKYKEYCISQYKIHHDQNLLERFIEDDDLIDYFSHFSSPLRVFSEILDNDFRGAHFIDHYFNYIEMIERRNLIVHKGEI